jgi:thermitase
MRLSAYAALASIIGIAALTSHTLGEVLPHTGGEADIEAHVDQKTEAAPSQALSQRPSWNWGQRKLDSAQAWRLTKGDRRIVVAVIDTGIDGTHPDLVKNIWVNPGEIPANGIDDDGNGYVDDVNGWNFVDDNSDLTDRHGHGTHIAGIIGANGPTLQGVAPEVSIMVLKYFDPKSKNQNPLVNTVEAIRYAVKMGADIINYSGGGLNSSEAEFEAIKEASKAGILFVAAAGNEKSDSDRRGYFPADYDLPNILSVTAIDSESEVLPSSNWGENTVDLAAPGKDIFSTLPDHAHGYMTGTSQATAFVTGVAVLLKASHPELQTPEKIIAHLLATGEYDSKHIGKTRSRTILNSYRSLATKSSEVDAMGNEIPHLTEVQDFSF